MRRRFARYARNLSVLRPYLLAWGLYKRFLAPSRKIYRFQLKRGEVIQLERK